MDKKISFELEKRLFLVTGASSGIGREIAIQLSRHGAKVLLCARNESRLQEVADKCEDRAICCPYDLADVEGLPGFVRNLAKKHGTFSGLVHSAGIDQLIPLRALQVKNIFDVFSLNVVAGIMLLKGMSSRNCYEKGASTVFLSSVAGHVGKPGLLSYSMSKGAIEQAVKSLSLELLPLGIRVNAVSPAMIRTPMVDKLLSTLSPIERQRIEDDHPGGIGSPEDVAAAVIYLLSDASKFVTGTSLLVDGGYCAQ